MLHLDDTIVAPATASGGALSLVRVSGTDALTLCDKVFRSPTGKRLADRKGYTLLYGNIVYPDGGVLDDVVVSVFRAPHSYTGDDMAEISCHGSRYITSEIINLLIAAGARGADAGEFTSRAFIAGKLDLSQAEAVADMIASHDRASLSLAATQMRGGYSGDLDMLRGELLSLASLLELELDFSEEDVTFADRIELTALIEKISARTDQLISSFSLGNAIKEGIGVAIIGSPNAGKSTLLNTLLNEDRAMVSDIEGTTRDSLEERLTLGGMEFRFIDTAGIRASDDTLERMGIERTFKAIDKARVILYMFDVNKLTISGLQDEIAVAISEIDTGAGQELCILLNKCEPAGDSDDRLSCRNETSETTTWQTLASELESGIGQRVIPVSAKYGYNIGELTNYLTSLVDTDPIYSGATIISNSRHYEALLKTSQALRQALAGLSESVPESDLSYRTWHPDNIHTDLADIPRDTFPCSTELSCSLSTDLIAQDIREALHWLGTITGEITTNEILVNIFSKFCIGK